MDNQNFNPANNESAPAPMPPGYFPQPQQPYYPQQSQPYPNSYQQPMAYYPQPTQGYGNVCPYCKLTDQVQKVSAIVSSGITSGASMSAGIVGHAAAYSVTNSVQLTSLAKRLYPPNKPEQNRVPILLLLGFGVLLTFGFASSPLLTIVGIPTVIFSIWALIKSNQKHLAGVENYNQRLAYWQSLYYCYRDDISFDPNGTVHKP